MSKIKYKVWPFYDVGEEEKKEQKARLGKSQENHVPI